MSIIQPASKMKLISLTILAVVISGLFSFLGAPLLRVLHNVVGAFFYWVSGALVGILLIASSLSPVGSPLSMLLPVLFLVPAIWVAIGIYGEFEKRGSTGFWSLATATALGTAVAVLGPAILLWAQGKDVAQVAHDALKPAIDLSAKQGTSALLPGIEINADFIVSQLPSILAGVMVISLAVALTLDKRVAALAGLRFEQVAARMRLLEFRLPDWMIWVTMSSFLLSFLKLGIPLVSTVAFGLFNVLVVAYFFQGLAILESAFAAFRVGFFLRLVIYVFVVAQLFFLLSLVGLIDYWVDFRRRLRGMSSLGKDRNNGENV